MSDQLSPAAVQLEQQKAWEHGDRVKVEELLEKHPGLEQDQELLLDLIYNERTLRERAGDVPSLAEYVTRFPYLENELAIQFGLDEEFKPSGPVVVLPVNAEGAAPLKTLPFGSSPAAPSQAASNTGVGPLPSVPGYALIEELGRGGMGVVYKGHQVRLNRPVALKMIVAGRYSEPETLTRFRREAEAVARLQHQNIVQIYEVGETGGQPFFSLEFVDGCSLYQKLDGKPLPARQAAELTEVLARAMHVAHQRGIIHRDLKPANILLAERGAVSTEQGGTATDPTIRSPASKLGVPKITDFGLAKRFDPEVTQTQTGEVMGTPPYMAPEQAQGKVKELGPAVDIYAPGAILYELLTGRPPFLGETPLDTLLQVKTQEPVPPRRLQLKVPRDLETICLKCLQKEPGRRYLTAEALADDLRRFLAGEPINARPISSLERTWKWTRRRPTVAALLAVIVAAVVGVIVLSLGYNVRVQRAAQREYELRVIAENNEQEAEDNLYNNLIARIYEEWSDGRVSRAKQLLQECRPEQRGWEWAYLDNLCHKDLLTLPAHGSPLRCVASSPDGKLLAIGGEDGTIRVWGEGKGERNLPGHKGPVYGLAWSRGGWLASAGDDGIVKVSNVDTGALECTLSSDARRVRCVSWSPDGRLLAAGREDGKVRVWAWPTRELHCDLTGHRYPVQSVAFSPRPGDPRLASGGGDTEPPNEVGELTIWNVESGLKIRDLSGHASEVHTLAWHHDGRRLASGSRDWTIKVWDPQSGQVVFTLDRHQTAVQSVAWSPDGLRLASGSKDRTIKIWSMETGREAVALRGHTDMITGVVFSSNEQLVSASWDKTVKRWDATVANQEALILCGHRMPVTCVAFSSRADRFLASGGGVEPPPKEGGVKAAYEQPGELKIWSSQKGVPPLDLQGHTARVTGVAFHPDGRLLASSSDDQTVRVWEVDSGKLLHTLRGHLGPVYCVAYSPDRKLLASGGEDGTVRVWTQDKGELARVLKKHGVPPVQGLAWASDGRLASAGKDESINVWDLGKDQPTLTFEGHGESMQGYKGIRRVAWSPDSRHLCTGSDDYTLKVWDATTGKAVPLKGHADVISGMMFTPDGKRLFSCSYDQTLKVWNPATGKEALTLRGHDRRIHGMAMSPDGRRIASASGDRTIRVWDATPRQP